MQALGYLVVRHGCTPAVAPAAAHVPCRTTLLQLVFALRDGAEDDAHLVEMAAQRVNSGEVVLCGTFAGARLECERPTTGSSETTTGSTVEPARRG